MPRMALWLLCAAYILPGLFGRDPWRNADISAFGYMWSIAQGQSEWSAPSVGGLYAETALLPYWLGASFIKLLAPMVEPALAARIPFAALLALGLLLTWLSAYHLARADAAQPIPFAFGGEANPVDYARAVADGALLAMIATLGLLQLGHETTPELLQFTAACLFLYGMCSVSSHRRFGPALAIMLSLPTLSTSGAPAMSLALGVGGTFLFLRSENQAVRKLVIWLGASTLLAASAAALTGAWSWRVSSTASIEQFVSTTRTFAWFLWPVWPMALWTLWRWRKHLWERHISVPFVGALGAVTASVAMGGSDRALMLGVPSFAILAAFALPTLTRAAAAAIDWFAVFFFSLCTIIIWVVYASMQTGVPAKPAANVARLVNGFIPSFSPLALGFAIVGTLAWVWLVKWRAGRNQHALWKSLVLPAGGVALCWLLLMTLWLPLLDYARSYRPVIQRVALHLPKGACVAMPEAPRGFIVAMEFLGGYRVEANKTLLSSTRCEFLLRHESSSSSTGPAENRRLIAEVKLPRDRKETIRIYRLAP